jgi:hypothetical protein
MELTLDPDPNFIAIKAVMVLERPMMSLWELQKTADGYRHRSAYVNGMRGEIAASKVSGDHVECMINLDLRQYPDAEARVMMLK